MDRKHRPTFTLNWQMLGKIIFLCHFRFVADIPFLFCFVFHIFHLFLENIYATLPRTQRGQPIVLGGDPKGKNFLYCNGNSVIIRNIEVSSNDTLYKHTPTIIILFSSQD